MSEETKEGRARRKRMMGQEIKDWSDEDLIHMLHHWYDPPVIPPCRVCGGKLAIQAMGGGQPTKYAHQVHLPSGMIDWDHYEKSGYEDRKQGGDEAVIELIKRYEGKR